MDELIQRLRDLAESVEFGEWEVPIGLYAALQAAADELEKRRWVSVEARRPEEGEAVTWWIVPDKEGKCGFSISSTYEEWGGIPVAATHWMPSPDGPKEDKV